MMQYFAIYPSSAVPFRSFFLERLPFILELADVLFTTPSPAPFESIDTNRVEVGWFYKNPYSSPVTIAF